MASALGPTLASRAASYKRQPKKRPAPAQNPLVAALTAKKAKPAPQALPAGGFKAALGGAKAPQKMTTVFPGYQVPTGPQTVPTSAVPTRAAKVAGPPAPKTATPSPKRTSTHTMTGPQTPTPYHAPTPPPQTTVPKKVVSPRDAAVQRFTAAAGGKVTGATGAAGSAVQSAANAVTAAPVTAAPPPSTSTPAAAAATAAAAPIDAYSGFPPEVAALLRQEDQQTAAQTQSLQGYFGNQAAAAQQFATGIGAQTAGLAQLAGIPTGLQNGATSGLPGAVTSLPAALGLSAQQQAAAQGLGTTNAAAIMPGFLRQAGLEATQTLQGAAQKARGSIISDYVDQQGQLARTMAEQQGADARQAAQIESSERIAAQQQATQGVNNLLDFISTMANAAQASGDKQSALEYQNMWHNLSAQVATRGQDLSAATAGARIAVGATKDQARVTGDYQKRLRAAAGGVRDMLVTEQPKASVRTKDAKGNSVTRSGWYDAQGNFTTEPQFTVNMTAEQAMTNLINASGLKPRDAYNLVNSATRQLGAWTGKETDVFNALVNTGIAPAQARSLTHDYTGRWVDMQGNPILGPPSPAR